MLAIYKKELRTYFTSMVGYAFMAFFLVIIGVCFYMMNLYSGSAKIEDMLSSITFIFALLAPVLTMRLMAEENKQKTDQLLLTSPLSASAIVIGKFLAVLTIFGAVMVITCTYPLILRNYGTVNMLSAYAAILGFTLLGGAYLAIGLFISSLTESQVMAAVISFVVFLLTVLMDSIVNIIPKSNTASYTFFLVILLIICIVIYRMIRNLTVSVAIGLIGGAGLTAVYMVKPVLFDGLVEKVVNWLSVLSRYDSFYYGTFDVSSIVYYLSIIFIFTFFTVQVVKKKRWS